MPAFLAPIAVFLAQIIGPLTGRVLWALGIGVVSLTGVQSGINALLSQVKSHFGGVPGDMASLVTLSGFDVFISLVISAHVGIVGIHTLYGAYKRFGFAVGGDG
tara:strand:- start:999 stop:1310 length:312 start_codon:yes stop_codon:yes gene_type:complete